MSGYAEIILDKTTHEIVAELSLSVGANKFLMIQNKTSGRIVIYPSATPPPVGQEMSLGFFLKSGETITLNGAMANKFYITGSVGSVAIANY